MTRFTNIEHHPIEETPVREYKKHPLLPLREALDPLISKISGLEHYIKTAIENCHYPSKEGLTRDESAAIFLYTMNWGQHSLHRMLNNVLRIQDRHALKPWHGYLRLFRNALKKLPATQQNVWRGIDANIGKNYRADTEMTWWSFTSCSSSLSIIRQFVNSSIKSTVFMIEAKNAISIEKYSRYPTEHEVILDLGTRLKVESDALTDVHTNLVHLVEISDRSSPLPSPVIPKEKLIRPIGFILPNTLSSVPSSDDDHYEGEKKNGKRHGKGTCNYADGKRYVGEWKDDLPSGYGIFTTKDGAQYRGEFLEGKFHGKGIYYYVTGDIYKGEFINDEPEGKGSMIWKDGNRYKGEFRNGQVHGSGTLFYANGTFFRGHFANGKIVQ